jgi:hypothetical protein
MKARDVNRLPPITFFEANTLEQQIAQRAFTLRQLLRVDGCEFSRDGYLHLKTALEPLLDHVLAADTILLYMRMYDVNYVNKHRMTLLHLLILFAPDLADLLIKNPDFIRINYRCFSESNHLHATALDIAIERWMEGECDYRVIELLLKYGARVPSIDSFVMPSSYLLDDICDNILFNPKAVHTMEQAMNLLSLLTRYGFPIHEAFSGLNKRWFANNEHMLEIEMSAKCGMLHQDAAIEELRAGVLRRLLDNEAPEFLVKLTTPRLAAEPSPRRYSEIKGTQSTFFDPPPSPASLSDVLYGFDNDLGIIEDFAKFSI